MPKINEKILLRHFRFCAKKISMKYMLLIYQDEQVLSREEYEQCYKDSATLTQELNSKGKYIAANPLHSVTTAKSVRVREGKRLVTDGPFAETREQLGGYFLINAANIDEATEIASQIPGAKNGTVEIRPVMEIEGLPV